MWDWLETTLGAGFMPHGHCYLWTPSMVWLQVGSNTLIGVAYLAISLTLYYIVRRIKDVPFSWMYVAFGGFILACGCTHFLDVVTVWHPIYWADGAMRALTAVASLGTAGLLIYLVPQTVALGESARRAQAQGLQLKAAFHELEAAHAKTKLHLAAIVESSEDAILSQTLDGVITTWNRGAEQLFGYASEDAVGRPGSILVPESLWPEATERLRSIGENERFTHFETTRRRRNGTEVAVSVTLSPIRDESQAVIGASTIARDITELKRRDADLMRSNADLEQFAYVASHDLQEPLRMVANYTELLAERYRGKLDEKADKYIHYASDGARRMQRLVADLLEYSRVGTQGKPLVPVHSTEVLKDVLQNLERAIADTGARFELGDLPAVMADEGQLRQLFQNLVGNALKFRSEDVPVIQIGAQRERDGWTFSVKDNGIGIEPQYAERVFHMFQRLHAQGKYEGSGIGLAIAKRIVERHGGRIWLEPQAQGTAFRFTLPAA